MSTSRVFEVAVIIIHPESGHLQTLSHLSLWVDIDLSTGPKLHHVDQLFALREVMAFIVRHDSCGPDGQYGSARNLFPGPITGGTRARLARSRSGCEGVQPGACEYDRPGWGLARVRSGPRQ